MFGDNPPGWLRWANTSGARAVTTMIAVIALILSGILAIRQQAYINCVADQQQADAARTRAIAAATDIERQADAALIAGPVPNGPSAEALRARAAAARAVTDQVRRQNQPPAMKHC